MTHEQYITLETAKLARQAGFDWECIAYYGCSAYDEGNERSFTLLKDDYYGIQNWNEKESWDGLPRFSAPTQSVLQRWLREVHEWHINVVFCPSDALVEREYYEVMISKYNHIPAHDIIFYTGTLDDGNKDLHFPSFEEALEAGLKECLTLIIKKQ